MPDEFVEQIGDDDPSEHRRRHHTYYGTLYVVLHGLVCLTDLGPAGFVGHILEMGREHEYLYGDWLLESKIPPRARGQAPFAARLVGVEAGLKKLDPDKNVILQLSAAPDDNHINVRALFYLPRPYCIEYFQTGEVDPSLFSDVDDFVNRKVPSQVSAIRIFVYRFPYRLLDDGGNPQRFVDDVALVGRDGTVLWHAPDLAKVRVDDDDSLPCSYESMDEDNYFLTSSPEPMDDEDCLPSSPLPGDGDNSSTFADPKKTNGDGDGDGDGDGSPNPSHPKPKRFIRVAVLHIYNEPAYEPDDPTQSRQHNIDEFKSSAEFLGLPAATISDAADIDDANSPPLPVGLLQGEVDPLSERTMSVLSLLRTARGDDEFQDSGGGGGTVCNGANGQVPTNPG